MDSRITETPLLELRNVSYIQKQQTIVKDINLKLYPGEIHAFVGDRGTGKSTLGKLMALMETPSTGKIFWEGKEVSNFKSFKTTGIQVVHQEGGLIDYFCVAENLFLPEKIFKPFPFTNKRKMGLMAADFFKKHGFSLNPASPVNSLNLSEKTTVTLLRSIYRKPKLLIIDEALEKLSGMDHDKILYLLQELARQKVAIVCISHRIDDIYNLAETISVIRDGRILLTDATKNIDRLNLIKMCYTQVTRNKKTEDINKEFYQLLRYNEAILKNLPITLIVTDDQNNIKMINDQGQGFFKGFINNKEFRFSVD